MTSDLLRQQLERNKVKFEQARTSEKAKRGWKYKLGGLLASVFLFAAGAGLESFTKFFKDSIPGGLKEALCYLSDSIRSNQHPHQYTVVVLPLRNDTDDRHREEIVSSFNDTAYELNIITPCVPVTLGVKGRTRDNVRAYDSEIERMFSKYGSDLIITGEIGQQKFMLNGYTRQDLEGEKAFVEGDFYHELHDPASKLNDSNILSVEDAKQISKFLEINIVRSLEFKMRQIRCGEWAPLDCLYPGKVKFPDDVTRTISHFAMMYVVDYSDHLDIDRYREGLFENRDYYEELGRIREFLKDKLILPVREQAFPIILNLLFAHGQTAFFDANGKKRSLLSLGIDLAFETAGRDSWRLIMYGLLLQKRGQNCRVKNDVDESMRIFLEALDDKEHKSSLNQIQRSLAMLWLGRSQALLYTLGDIKDKVLMKQELSKTIAYLNRSQVDWNSQTSYKLDKIEARFHSELDTLRAIDYRIDSPTLFAGIGSAFSEFCER
jgi:hypothetical protein